MTRRLGLALAMLAIGLAEPAAAHSPIKGIGAFYNGLLHPVLVPAHLLGLAALGLIVGQHATRGSRFALPAFATAIALALAVTSMIQQPMPPWPILATALAGGLAVALAPPFGATILPMLVAVAAGLLVGLDSMPDRIPEQQVWLALSGTALGAVLAVTYVGGLAAWLDRPWQKIAIRVAGSWIAASAILVLTLDLTSMRPPA